MSDLSNNPEFLAFARRIRAHVAPMIRASAISVSIVPEVPEETDIKFAVELGLSIMLDKPLIMVVRPGTKLPDHLVRVADAIVDVDLDNPAGQHKLQDAIEKALERVKANEAPASAVMRAHDPNCLCRLADLPAADDPEVQVVTHMLSEMLDDQAPLNERRYLPAAQAVTRHIRWKATVR